MLAALLLGPGLPLLPLDDPVDQLVATIPKGFEPVRIVEADDGDEVSQPLAFTFSPDRSRVAYLAQKKRRIYALVDDDDVGYGDDGGTPVFSGDGEHVAVALVKKNRNGTQAWSIHVDDRVVAKEDWVGPLSLSHDGDALAYWSQPDYKLDHEGEPIVDRNELVLAHRKNKKYRQTRSDTYEWGSTFDAPYLSPDGTRAIGAAYSDGTGKIVSVGDREDEVLHSSDGYSMHPRYAPGAARIATVIRNYGAERGAAASSEWTPYEIEVDGLPFEVEADAWALPRFSQNGEHLAFVYHRYGLFGVGVDETLLPTREGVILQAVADDTGTRIAYVLSEEGELPQERWLYRWCASYVQGGKQCVVLADLAERETADAEPLTLPGPEFTSVEALTFSPDGKRLAYLAWEEDGSVQLVCGDRRSAPAAAMTAPKWLDDDTLVVGTRDGREFWRRYLVLTSD